MSWPRFSRVPFLVPFSRSAFPGLLSFLQYWTWTLRTFPRSWYPFGGANLHLDIFPWSPCQSKRCTFIVFLNSKTSGTRVPKTLRIGRLAFYNSFLEYVGLKAPWYMSLRNYYAEIISNGVPIRATSVWARLSGAWRFAGHGFGTESRPSRGLSTSPSSKSRGSQASSYSYKAK